MTDLEPEGTGSHKLEDAIKTISSKKEVSCSVPLEPLCISSHIDRPASPSHPTLDAHISSHLCIHSLLSLYAKHKAAAYPTQKVLAGKQVDVGP